MKNKHNKLILMQSQIRYPGFTSYTYINLD